jgi:ABC-2 type transport system permease protein
MAKLQFLKQMPFNLEVLVSAKFEDLITPVGSIAISFIDPVVLFAALSWGIARGSDAIAGEIGRGTMELLLAQPVRRMQIVITQGVVTTLGAALLACASMGGVYAGIHTVSRKFAGKVEPLSDLVSGADFWPGAINLFGLMFFLAGISTLASAWESYRWRTIGLIGTIYVVALLMKMIGRLGEQFDWLTYATFLTAFEPHKLILDQDAGWTDAWRYTGLLVALGLLAYAGAIAVFAKRDLPAPS